MSTTLRVSDETKAKLEALKDEDETFDELLDRLTSHERPLEAGAWEGTDKADRARDAVKRTRESFEGR